jgi:hypothetical protein
MQAETDEIEADADPDEEAKASRQGGTCTHQEEGLKERPYS